MSEQTTPSASALLDGIKENAGLTTASGVLLIIAGMLALLSPLYAGLWITIMVGVLLLMSGISQCFLAFKAGAFGRGLLMFLIGLLMIVAGSYLTTQPVSGLASITLFLAAYFIAAGLCELVIAFNVRPADGWGWQLFNGLVTLALGVMLWRQYPLSGAWAVGILFGIKMVFSGWALVFLGRSANAVANASATPP